jgi:hypothetical protein
MVVDTDAWPKSFAHSLGFHPEPAGAAWRSDGTYAAWLRSPSCATASRVLDELNDKTLGANKPAKLG